MSLIQSGSNAVSADRTPCSIDFNQRVAIARTGAVNATDVYSDGHGQRSQMKCGRRYGHDLSGWTTVNSVSGASHEMDTSTSIAINICGFS